MRRKPSACAIFSQRRAGIGDGDEARAGAGGAQRLLGALVEIRLEDVGLRGRARLAGDDEQRVLDVDRIVERLDLRRVGGVEHMQLRPAGEAAEVSPRTSGPRLEPPMPMSTTLEKFSRRTSLPNLSSSSTRASSSPTMVSQSSHFASSPPVHSALSRCHRRRALPSARHCSSVCLTAVSSSLPRLAVCRLSRGPSTTARLCATAPSSLSAASANSFTPSASNWSVTASSEMPARSSASRTRCASSTPSSRVGRSLPWSRNASRVAGGSVLTVSGPISSST